MQTYNEFDRFQVGWQINLNPSLLLRGNCVKFSVWLLPILAIKQVARAERRAARAVAENKERAREEAAAAFRARHLANMGPQLPSSGRVWALNSGSTVKSSQVPPA